MEQARQAYGKLFDTNDDEFEVPDFTIRDIRDAIPPECFERSALLGLFYIFRDLVLVISTLSVAVRFIRPEYLQSLGARGILWSIYGFVNGLFGTSLWVLAHECGHQAFSTSKILNDTVGFILHSALLVPYFAFKITHGKHHKATGHIEKDMVFLPRLRSQYATRFGLTLEQLDEVSEDAPLRTLLDIIVEQLVAWPIYLLTNETGHSYKPAPGEERGGRGKPNAVWAGVNHFNPRSPMFDAKDARLIALSDLGVLMMVTLIALAAGRFGWGNVLLWYFLPYLWTNHWVVALTYLQHTDPFAPALRRRVVVFRARRSLHHRPRLRLHRTPHLPQHHRDARPASLRLHDSILPCEACYRSHQAGHG